MLGSGTNCGLPVRTRLVNKKILIDAIGLLLIALVVVVGYKLSPLLLPKADVILVTHDHEEAFAMADRIAVLNFGQKIAEGSPAEVRENREVLEAYLGHA